MYKFLIRTLSFVRVIITSIVAVQKDTRGRHPLPCGVVVVVVGGGGGGGWTAIRVAILGVVALSR